MLTGFGLSAAVIGLGHPQDIDAGGAYLLGAGVGAAVGSLLPRAGFEVSQPGLAVTVAGAGLILALSPRADALTDARTYALAIGVVGLFNVALGVIGARQRQTERT